MAGSDKAVYIGIDFGTSGCRAACLDDHSELLSESAVAYGTDAGPEDWRRALREVILKLPERGSSAAICIDGTSATAMLCRGLEVLQGPLMYNYSCSAKAVARCRELLPAPEHTAAAPTSTLSKACEWIVEGKLVEGCRLVHQADWLLAQLLGTASPGTDYHNALKLGYDIEELQWPSWLTTSEVAPLLPQVFSPGETIGYVGAEAAAWSGLPETCRVAAGTTDSIAAFLAAGTSQVGEAVTSLGSTMAIKMRSPVRVENSTYGVYSHRLGAGQWLVGGASNTGGAVLRKYFSDEDLDRLSGQIDPEVSSGLDYYPLASPGERFPICDASYAPRLSPRPAEEASFLHGILEGMARIEADAYAKLNSLGAGKPIRVFTAGGGAKNDTWRRLRQRLIGVQVEAAENTEASCGTALLAMRGSALLG